MGRQLKASTHTEERSRTAFGSAFARSFSISVLERIVEASVKLDRPDLFDSIIHTAKGKMAFTKIEQLGADINPSSFEAFKVG